MILKSESIAWDAKLRELLLKKYRNVRPAKYVLRVRRIALKENNRVRMLIFAESNYEVILVKEKCQEVHMFLMSM